MPAPASESRYTPAALLAFAENVFLQMGCPPPDAAQAAESLLAADLRGVDSHGVARLSGYVRLWEAGRINPTPNIQVVHQTPSTAVIDGDGGLGLVVGPRALDLASEKATAVGTGWVAVRNSNHFGIAGYHALRAVARGQIGLAMTNASPLVAPTRALKRLLGTNPIAVAIPAGDEPPFVADLATTTAANGKLEILQRKGLDAPLDWLQDAAGQPTPDAHGVAKGGALRPLGGDTASHKGYALGAVVDIFSAVLSGANYGPWVPPFVAFLQPPPDPVGAGLGHFFGAMRVDAFRPEAEFRAAMDHWIRTFRAAPSRRPDEPVLIPGDPERAAEADRRATGIPLLPAVVADLEKLAGRFGLAAPAAL